MIGASDGGRNRRDGTVGPACNCSQIQSLNGSSPPVRANSVTTIRTTAGLWTLSYLGHAIAPGPPHPCDAPGHLRSFTPASPSPRLAQTPCFSTSETVAIFCSPSRIAVLLPAVDSRPSLLLTIPSK